MVSSREGERTNVPTGIPSYADVLDRFPSRSELADAIGKPESTVRSWHRRDSIPVEHFALIGQAAHQLGIPVTEQTLWDIFKARNHPNE